MTSRLDRLFILLETGSSSSTRKTAASQLASVVRQHPAELPSLLSRLALLLKSPSWETRVAAGGGVEALLSVQQLQLQQNQEGARSGGGGGDELKNGAESMSQVKVEQPEHEHGVDADVKPYHNHITESESHDEPPSPPAAVSLCVKDLLPTLLNPHSTKLLMGSEGSNYDRVVKLDEKHQKELIAKNLIGSDQLGTAVMDSMQELVDDLASGTGAPGPGPGSNCNAANSSPDANSTVCTVVNVNAAGTGNSSPPVQLSSRELNLAKRRAKRPAAAAAAAAASSSALQQSSEKKPKLVEIHDLEEWTQMLLDDLFSAEWEVRHGAGIGLRESFKHKDVKNFTKTTKTILEALAFDRFGDFVSDQVVAPVRETLAQCLGALYRKMPATLLAEVRELLIGLLAGESWETRHGALLGLKYLLVVDQSQSSSPTTLTSTFHPILSRLSGDSNDDVVTAAASCFQPIVTRLVKTVDSNSIQMLVDSLWSSLKTLDDLSSACNSIMTLLAAVLREPEARNQPSSLDPLLSLLHPFLHHSSSSVRRSALQSIHSLCSTPSIIPPTPPGLQLTLRHLHQRALLELTDDILQMIPLVWQGLLRVCSKEVIAEAACPMLGLWIYLAMLHPRVPIDVSWLVQALRTDDRIFIASSSPDPLKIAGTRFTLSRLLADVFPSVPDLASLANLLEAHLGSKSSLQRSVIGLALAFWPETEKLLEIKTEQLPCSDNTKPALTLSNQDFEKISRLTSLLISNLTTPCPYDEISSTFSRLQTECKDFIATLKHYGLEIPWMSSTNYDSSTWLNMEEIQRLGGDETQALIDKKRGKVLDILSERRRGVHGAWVEATKEWRQISCVTLSCQAAAIVRIGLTLPPKLNPLIKPLVDSIRYEQNSLFQHHSAKALVRLMDRVKGKVQPNAKIITNLVGMLNEQQEQENSPTIPTGGASTVANKQDSGGGGVADSIEKRGAKMALKEICHFWGAEVKTCKLWDVTVGVLQDEGKEPNSPEVRSALSTLAFISPHLSRGVFPSLAELLPKLLNLLSCSPSPVVENGPGDESSSSSNLPPIRQLSSRLLAVWSLLLPDTVMPVIVTDVVLLMKGEHQQGAIEAVHAVVEEMGLDILPWIVLLVVPVLNLMSAHSPPTRTLASLTFASLIRLLPLESAIPSPPSLPQSLVNERNSQRTFLEQLLNPTKIPPYKMTITVKAKLRPYQEAGVNWLGFLQNYGLHGILCDDMGLGKTLMCICLLAEEGQKKVPNTTSTNGATSGSGNNSGPCPSIVICPPTLTGHWVYEITKFVSPHELNPLHYHGPPAERARLQAKLPSHNLIVASYDIVRNDLDFFSAIQFNYCVLDEGHVIKNGKTKISRSIKQLRANHRLILSGTPIQNNVLELWSLFDFLMPGFLGSEKQFSAKFGRPILQARDAKSSEKEQEAGALAMEALHRQTLPFLLRRLKEDVLQDLPPKITQDYYCELSPLQSQLYEDFARTRAHRSLKENLTSQGQEDCSHIFQALQYLRKVCNHPKLVLTHAHPQYSAIMSKLRPGELNEIRQGAKLEALRQLLTSLGIGGSSMVDAISPHRALIFCQLKSMLDIVEHDLLKQHMPSVTYMRLDGSVPAGQRHTLVQRFNYDVTIDLLLLTTQVGGLGLNLTGADTVIFVEHDWNPMRDLQAMDRAHRIGQKRTVNVYRLITRGTLEEKIMGLQKFKLMTARTVISGENAGLETMQTEQLLDLFTLDPETTTPAPAAAAAAPAKGTTATGSGSDGQKKVTDDEGLVGAYRSVLEAVPELWEERLYDEEFDLSNFIKGLANKS